VFLFNGKSLFGTTRLAGGFRMPTKILVGKTDQDRIKNAGIPTGISPWLLKTSSF